jgi:CRISPR-associated endonuclease Cas1
VIIGHSGEVTLDALRWIADVGASFSQVDADGRLIVASGPRGIDSARLRRNQAMATVNGVGMAIGRELVRRKLEGQLRVMSVLGAENRQRIVTQSVERVDLARTPQDLRSGESIAANAYWAAWASVPVQFHPADRRKLPEHWLTFWSRSSPLTGQPRRAGNPANAVLNYLYAILEAETTIALMTMGLDPGMGFFHVDSPQRQSLSADVMEVIRPEADAFLLALLSERVFRAAEFFERRDGVCRLMAPMAAELSNTARQWGEAVAPVVEWVAERLNESGQLVEQPITATLHVAPLPTKLTESRRWAQRRAAVEQAGAAQPGSCSVCGTQLASRRVKYCTTCREIYGHRGRRSSLSTDRPRTTDAEVRRLFRALRDLSPAQWARVQGAAHAAGPLRDIVERVERVARSRSKRVPVRAARDPDLNATALAACPLALRPTVGPFVASVARAVAVRDELAPGEFERLYQPLAAQVPQEVWAGDELMSYADREALSALYTGGMSASQIATQLGVGRESVLRRLRI